MLNKSQEGYATFVVTLITIFIVSLVVIAFATVARLEQKDAQGNNLASQAYYAAESGINDAYAIISAEINHNPPIAPESQTTGCTDSSYVMTENGVESNQLDNSLVQYTCLQVNTEPDSLLYQDVAPGESEVLELSSASGSAINYVTISWQYYQSSASGPLVFSGCPAANNGYLNLPAENAVLPNPMYTLSTCGAGVLQLDIVSNTQLVSNANTPAETIFLEPVTNNGAAVNAKEVPASEDAVYNVSCSQSSPAGYYACTATIETSPPSVIGSDTNYYLRLQDFYQTNNLAVTAYNAWNSNGANSPLDLSNAQILIDSTGYAGGQLKRLQERVCYGNYCNNGAPAGAIQSTECISKQFESAPGDSSTPPASSC